MAKVQDIPENTAKCFCPRCPTWLATSCPKEKNEILYCSKGKTACDLEKMGCLCGACPVHTENNLTGAYYCFNGAEE